MCTTGDVSKEIPWRKGGKPFVHVRVLNPAAILNTLQKPWVSVTVTVKGDTIFIDTVDFQTKRNSMPLNSMVEVRPNMVDNKSDGSEASNGAPENRVQEDVVSVPTPKAPPRARGVENGAEEELDMVTGRFP